MVKHSLGDTGKYLNKEWHNKRWEAESETFSIDEWGDIDRVRYDLDEVDFSRKYKDSSFETENRVESEGGVKSGFDVRDLPARD